MKRTRDLHGQHPCSPNKLRFVSLAYVMAFDPLIMTVKYLTQPLQSVVGDNMGALGPITEKSCTIARRPPRKTCISLREPAI